MRGWWQDLTDLVLPAECGGCGRPRTVLCAQCRAALSGAVPRRVRPLPEPAGLPPVYAAAPYRDAVRAALLAHKERGALPLATPLGAALARAVRSGLAGECGSAAPAVLLVPLPSARWAVRARGHDPARRIALAASRELRRAGTPARVAAVLRQRRAVADQAGLNSRQRLENLAGALVVAPGGARLLAEGVVVLVDDLMTTGASLTEAARAVRAATAGAPGRYARTAAAGGAGDAGAYAAEEVQDVCGGAPSAVYAAVRREGRGGRTAGATEEAMDGPVPGPPGEAEAGARGGVICAAVVAASPDSFEINRN